MKGGPFEIFQHPFCRKTPKKIEGGPFGEKTFSDKKSRNAKKTERGPFGFFNIHSVVKLRKN